MRHTEDAAISRGAAAGTRAATDGRRGLAADRGAAAVLGAADASPGAAPSRSALAGGSGDASAGRAAAAGYVSKTDMVAALIRELIITGELAAGTQLRQRDLAERFGVSQTPVREAMRRLESEGLVIGDTHRGFTVVVPDDGPVEENFQIRAALESLGASLAAGKIDADGIARLQDLNDQMRTLSDEDPRYAELNREFHFTLYEYSRSPLLMSLMRLLWASLRGGPRVLRTHAESARQHDAILDALRAGDAAAASALTHRHIMAVQHLGGDG
jgi:DNA-binding GntR family transcriptional regulator